MRTNRLLDNFREGRTSLGVWVNSPDMAELCAFLGLDWVMIDQMFTSHGWREVEELVRAAEASGITPVVRVQSNPWLGYDHRVAVDVTRLLGIGAQFILVSNSGRREIEECAEVAKDWHRKALTIHPYRDFEDWVRVRDEHERETFIIPQPETRGGLDDLPACIAMPDIKAVFVAMTDASRVLTGEHQPDWNHPALWGYVDQAVALGKEHGVVVGANTSYAYTMEEMKNRVKRLHEHGVKMIMVQGANFLFQVAMTEFLRDVRPALE